MGIKVFGTILAMMVSAAASASSVMSIPSSISDSPVPTSHDEAIDSLIMRCFVEGALVRQSRAAVLSIDRGDTFDEFDVAITSGHGLIRPSGVPYERCTVLDFKGQSYEVRGRQLAKGYAPGTPNDWAVIVFDRIEDARITRYSVANPWPVKAAENLAETAFPVLFASARGRAVNGQTCSALPRRYAGFIDAKYKGFLPHNCRATPGQSGAPISIVRGNTDILVGIHVGHSSTLKSPPTHAPARHGFMRIIDAHLLSDLNAMIDTIKIDAIKIDKPPRRKPRRLRP